MRIDILHFEGCPNHGPAMELAHRVVERLGIEAEINAVEVHDNDEAQRLRFLGSPTFQVDGVDIEPEARSRRQFAMSCRVYGSSGLPPEEMLTAALQASPQAGVSAPALATQVESARQDRSASRSQLGWSASALGVAMLSSACCWLPLVALGLGFSSIGAAAFLEAYRTWFILAAVALLSTAFYFSYLRKERCEPGGACHAPDPRIKRLNRGLFWVSAVFVAAFIFFPDYVGSLVGNGSTGANSAVAAELPLDLSVAGMTCEGCESSVSLALESVPGVLSVEADHVAGTARVVVSGDHRPEESELRAAVEKAGYQLQGVEVAKPGARKSVAGATTTASASIDSPRDRPNDPPAERPRSQ